MLQNVADDQSCSEQFLGNLREINVISMSFEGDMSDILPPNEDCRSL